MKLTYAIIGTGALGGYYGGRLAESGQEVHFLYHTEYDYVKAHGLAVKSVNGDFQLDHLNLYKDPKDMPPCDVVIVALKSTQNGLLPDMLRPIIKDTTTLILLQNGIGLEQELSESFPRNAIGGAMAFICAYRTSPGHITHADYGELTVAYLGNHVDEYVAKKIKTDFENAKVPYTQGDDLNFFRWRKLVWNIPYNGLTVILKTTTDRIMKDEASRQLARDLMQEVIEGARVCGTSIKDSFADHMMDNTDHMEPYAPSMRLDYDHHRKMEIKAIYSNAIHLAKEAGYAMKKVEMLEQQLKFIEAENLA